MSYHYCTCVKSKQKLRENADRNSRKMRLVNADKDGICEDCGYYAVVYHREVKDSSELYYLLRKDREEVVNDFVNTEKMVDTVKAVQSKWQEESKRKNKFTV